MINGNLSGVKKATVERLEALWELSVERDCFASAELLEEMAYITADTGREVSVYLSRAGDIEYVAIGEADRVNLDGLTLRRSEERLRSLRCNPYAPERRRQGFPSWICNRSKSFGLTQWRPSG